MFFNRVGQRTNHLGRKFSGGLFRPLPKPWFGWKIVFLLELLFSCEFHVH